MQGVHDNSNLPLATEIQVRVRYCECDPQGVAHHSVYPVWMEMARSELLRERGAAYRDLEAAGVLFVVADMALKYRRPAFYDDEIAVAVRDVTGADKKRSVRLLHEYEIRRDGVLLVSATTTLACVDKEGRLQAIPAGVLGE